MFGPTNGKCMSWWFHMYGATVANLNVYMKQVGKPESLVWNLNGSQVHLIFMQWISDVTVFVLHKGYQTHLS